MMIRVVLTLPTVALAQQPVRVTQCQRGAHRGRQLGRTDIGIEDDEAARERNQRDQNHYFDLDDAVPWAHHAEDGRLELRSNQQYIVMSNTLWNTL